MTCSGLVDEARVTVDTALLRDAAQFTPLLLLAFVLTLMGVALAVVKTPTGLRAWSFLGLLSPLAALVASWQLPLRTELHLACVDKPALEVSRLLTVCVLIAALAFVQLVVTLCLRAWKRELRVLWPVLLLTASLATCWAVAWPKHTQQREFERRVNAVMPVPNVFPGGTEPSAHVGLAVRITPHVQAAGRRNPGFLFIAPTRQQMSADDARRWHVDSVVLTPTHEGSNEVPLHFVQDLVTVDTELQVTGVRDEGPRWWPLAIGNRWEFVFSRGRGGTLNTLRARLEKGKRALPESTLRFEVTGEGERDGFHYFELTERRHDGTTSVHEIVRRDGELFGRAGRVAYADEHGCVLNLLTPSRCNCGEERLSWCRDLSDAMSETFARMALAFITLGFTELHGMGDMGAGNEVGVLMTRWQVGGVASDVVREARQPTGIHTVRP